MADKKKPIFFFGNGKADGHARMRELLGGKGAGLHEMTRIGIPVPPGFTITTEVCKYYYEHQHRYPKDLDAQINSALARMEKILGRSFGDADNPLLVSVRSGARESLPGMMDTVLNLGLNDRTVQGLIKRTNNPRFAFDAYRRFIQMYAVVVLGLKHQDNSTTDPLASLLEQKKKARGARLDTELTAKDLESISQSLQSGDQKSLGKRISRRAIRAIVGRNWRGVRIVEQRSGDCVSRALPDTAFLGHGSQRSGDGLRQSR